MEEKREIVFEGVVDTNILDEDLDVKFFKTLKEAKIKVEKEYYYQIEVTFDLKSYENEENLRNFVIHDKGNGKRDLISEILSEQLRKVSEKISKLGFDFSNSTIKGDELNNLNIVIIQMFKDKKKEYDKKGNLKSVLKVFNIMPDEPYIKETLIKCLTEAFKKQIDEDINREIEIKNHIPNMVKTDLVMERVVKGIFLDRKVSRKKMDMKKEDLLKSYKINSDFPLEVSGNFNTLISNKIDEIDVPELLIYKEFNNGNWTIKQVNNWSSVEDEITRYGYYMKEICEVVVLKNLEPLGFILLNKDIDGMRIINKQNANKYRKLQVCWK